MDWVLGKIGDWRAFGVHWRGVECDGGRIKRSQCQTEGEMCET